MEDLLRINIRLNNIIIDRMVVLSISPNKIHLYITNIFICM